MRRNWWIKIIAFLCALIFLVLSLCGCAAPNKQPGDGQTVSFTDALGRELKLSVKPARVAALLGSFADVWTLAGGLLCAASDDAWEDFGLTSDGAISLGGAHSPSLELLISAEPDLVLASASTASHVALRESLEQMGIAVVYFDVDHFEDYLAMLDICTDLTERKDLYEENGLALKEEIDRIKADYAALSFSERERSVLLLRAASSFVRAKGSEGTVLGEMLFDMGCINIADNDKDLLENLSVESVIEQEPTHIFVVTMGSNPDAAKASLENLIKENPAWGSLKAVREGRVHLMDTTLFHTKPNARWAQAYRVLYETLTK